MFGRILLFGILLCRTIFVFHSFVDKFPQDRTRAMVVLPCDGSTQRNVVALVKYDSIFVWYSTVGPQKSF